MKYIKTILLSSLILSGAATPVYAERPVVEQSDTIPEVHIPRSGVASISGAKVMQIANTTVFVRLQWDRTSMNMTIKTDEKTKITRRHGDPATVKDFMIGDYLNLEGFLELGSDNLVLRATKITNLSIQTVDAVSFKGTISEINVSGEKFKLIQPGGGVLAVEMKPDIAITKGTRRWSRFDIATGDYVSNITGVYDKGSNTLSKADKMTIHIDLNQFKPRNFQGTLRKTDGATLPTSMTVSVDGKEYTVRLNEKTEVWNYKKKPAELKRFVPGDVVRFYGNILEENSSVIDNVEIIRNLDL